MADNHTRIDHILEQENKKKQQSFSYSKESEPIPIRTDNDIEPQVEYVENEPTIEDKEVEKFIQVESDKFELDPKLKKAGLEVIDSSSLDPRHNVKLPIQDDQIIEGLHKPINSSWRWLAEIALFMLKRAHISLKKIHGHIVRVIKK